MFSINEPTPVSSRRPRNTVRYPLLRFANLTELIFHCRQRYQTAHVRTEYRAQSGALMLVVCPEGRQVFESLVVYMEGERAYLVEVPDKL